MAPTTRSAVSKTGEGKKAKEATSKTATITKKAGKRAAAKVAFPKRKASVGETIFASEETSNKYLPSVEEIRAAIRPGGTTVGDLMNLFEIHPEDREKMTKLLASIGNITSAVSPTSGGPAGKSPISPGNSASRVEQGFRPFFDRHRQPSVAERTFVHPHVSKYSSPVSPGRALSASGGLFAASPRRPSPLAGVFNASSPRRSDFGRMTSVSAMGGASPRKMSRVGSSPASSSFGRMSSVSGSSGPPKTPPTPQSPFASGSSEPATITVSASTKQEAEEVLARQQLVRESLFELRGILTNLNWKVQQFEVLVEKAEKDVIWDTASAEETFDRQSRHHGGVKSGKRVGFLFNDDE